ncbi:MAG: RIP metalloprotease RseP [Marinilabiliaceae bacterium]|nr:RIP metalloprotease RseP [Marinilabiliaceae bacterium]
MEILIKAGQLILSLSILVILHEFGHFFFARLFKTRVEKFYLFFDPWFSLFKYKKGDTEYGIGWLPLGGYVKISGMIDESMDKEQMKQPAQEWEFRSKPAWQRLLIMIGGVSVNFITAIVIYWMLLYSFGQQYIPASEAKWGFHYATQMHELGIKDGDIVVKADSVNINTPTDITHAILLDEAKTLSVRRGDSLFSVIIPADFKDRMLREKIKMLAELQIPFVVDSVIPGMNAAKAGIQKGDSIVALNGQPSGFFHQFAKLTSENRDSMVTITVVRDTARVDIPCMVNADGKVGMGNRAITSFFKVETINYSLWKALPAGISQGVEILVNYVRQLKLIFSKEGVKQIGGFGTIGSLFSPHWDWASFWNMTALLSIILAFMNILPIPALDGGHVLFLLYEIITRRKPSDKFLEYAQTVGMILLLGLLLYANGNDIFKWIFNH